MRMNDLVDVVVIVATAAVLQAAMNRLYGDVSVVT